ncbi:hypothetical protein SEA_MARIDALIA_75 [Gordonia phage Maridalia]|uniref:Uncharacterized protein n=1 Tax=Gordonia phage Maridalia TaxID=2488957 RepID=A0A3G8FVF5_9CAUD|nr:hypothetical protein PP490_gp75 [Gordonia phage Maridalia]AZF98814.1 hypothetical protein SEA_MARIDALIA_75 [Gordonia phage Maridalia]
MTRQKPINLDSTGYDLTDLRIWQDLTWRNAWYESSLVDDPQVVPNRQYLIDKGHNVADIDRVAVAFDHDRYITRYREYFVASKDREPELPVRDHLIDECGYPPTAVDEFLEKRAGEDRERARKHAEREAYERTWRYRARAAIREARDRASTAWAVLRGQHVCDCEGEW